jgi:hypothetical protein
MDSCTARLKDGEPTRRMDGPTDRQTDSQTDGMTDRQTIRQGRLNIYLLLTTTMVIILENIFFILKINCLAIIKFLIS